MINHTLGGCRINPISSYLKSLGLLRIAARLDPEVRACWRDNSYMIKSSMSKDRIVRFLLHEYEPTPIIAPWSVKKYEKTCSMLDGLLENLRFAQYAETIEGISGVFDRCSRITGHDMTEKIPKKHKDLLLRLCRSNLSDEFVHWMDSVFALGTKSEPCPLSGTGANDGNFDMAENFVKCIKKVLPDKDGSDESEKWLRSALFGGIVPLDRRNMSGHNPDGSGGPNSGRGFSGESLSNPWDYILMMEGTILFAGNPSRRLSSSAVRSAFPFIASTSNTGYGTASSTETGEGAEPESRGEIWLPVWHRPATAGEISHLFSEGRMQLAGKQAGTGMEFARAIVTLGAERGISEFHRFCILRRKGRAYLYAYAGKVGAANEPMVSLLEELDAWLGSITRGGGAPASLRYRIRQLEDAMMNLCSYKRRQDLLRVLVAVGRLERHISMSGGFGPLKKLSKKWIELGYDRSAEFRLAAAAASITEGRSIRENLEYVTGAKGRWNHDGNSVRCVWKEGDSPVRNIERVLQRRALDGRVAGSGRVPISGHVHARRGDIVRFLNRDLDEEKIGDLMLPLSMVEMTPGMDYPWRNERDPADDVPVPEAYAVMKLVYPPDPKEKIPYDMHVMNLLLGGRINDAYARAARILHVHGLSPLRYSRETGSGKTVYAPRATERRLMAALLFPVSSQDRKTMLEEVTVKRFG